VSETTRHSGASFRIDQIQGNFRIVTFDASGEKGLQADRLITKGEVLIRFQTEEKQVKPDVYSVQVGENHHVLLRPEFLRLTNHSCDPNIIMDVENLSMVALRDIQPGEGLAFFYPSTEWNMSGFFECGCGSAACLGRISGALYLDLAILRRYWLSPYIRKMTGLSNPAE